MSEDGSHCWALGGALMKQRVRVSGSRYGCTLEWPYSTHRATHDVASKVGLRLTIFTPPCFFPLPSRSSRQQGTPLKLLRGTRMLGGWRRWRRWLGQGQGKPRESPPPRRSRKPRQRWRRRRSSSSPLLLRKRRGLYFKGWEFGVEE
ncbi:hypothetical protein SAY87_023177 [Trapa incisa]|uniref:Uncharacterized protein n=1 Tax=Trapa incisa TaxID=236973 RepID=A0AAN7K4Z1_9MYRT|nr:hypothetical protein SAY87_023177 [Trapa incisa]